MSPIEHITEWQNMLRALLPQKSLFLFFVILFAALLAYAAQKTFRWLRAESVRSAKLRGRFFDHIAFDRPLQEAFSNGVIHPKIF